ncbi:hypothetical protein CEK62_20875 (plasmid) [Alcanivorax sp. N3-2A]|nr:hypothetical protein CEK62_00680 [Alcanivorax sp. N3-2A]ASK36815.1 hypothetical protein CEK62_20875 [Alcanivorax sp. N3-2A]
MKHRLLPAAHSRTRTLVPAVLGALVLSACGGDSSSHHDSSAGPLKITDDNAAQVVAQTLIAPEIALSLTNFSIPGTIVTSPECQSGSATLETSLDATNNERLSLLSADNCTATNDDETFREVLDGELQLTYDSPEPASPFFFDAQRFYVLLELSYEYFNSESLELDGSGKVSSDPAPSLTEANFTFKINQKVENETGDASEMNFQLSVKDWSSVVEMLSEEQPGVTTNGRLTPLLAEGLQSYVDVVTNTPRTYDGDVCSESGDITVNGADNTSINVYFAGSDQITVTVNGVAHDMSCDEFRQWLPIDGSPLSLR